MPDHPVPDGWGKNLMEPHFIRTLDGHVGTNVEDDPDLAADMKYRRNKKDHESGWPSDLDGSC